MRSPTPGRCRELGAGTLCSSGGFDLSEFAVVLEPDEPLSAARRLRRRNGRAGGRACGPRAAGKADRISVAGRRLGACGLVGGGRLAWPEGPEDEPPTVAGVRRHDPYCRAGRGEPGLWPLAAALEDEGFDGLRYRPLAESFSRHPMTVFDTWQ